MTMMRPVLLLLALFCSGSHQQCFFKNDATQYITKQHIEAWQTSQRNFSLSMFKVLNDEKRGEQVAFSPVSVYEALMLSYFGATHDTEKSLARVLKLPPNENKARIWRLYYTQAIIPRNKLPGYPLIIANRLYLKHTLRLRHCVDRKMRGELELIDYHTDPYSAQTYINNWITHMTGGMITNLINKITADTSATLVSAACFDGKWSSGFEHTRTMRFPIKGSGPRAVPAMYKIGHGLIGHEHRVGAHLLMLPYQGNDVSMIILLPDNDLDEMITSMTEQTLEYITDRDNYEKATVEMFLPKFKQSHHLRLTKAISVLGLTEIFTPHANFTGFTGKSDVSLTTLDHETVIKVDESGTTASIMKAAAAAAEVFKHKSQKVFTANRPFAYVIYDFFAKKVLIMGTLRSP